MIVNIFKPLFSGVLIGLILVAIIASSANSYLLIADKKREWSSPTEYLPEIKIPDSIANRIVTTVEAKFQ